MSEYKVREFKESDYFEVTEVVNQLFYPIFSPFVKLPFEKGGQFIRDFEMIDKKNNEGLYVIEINHHIAGVMKLNTTEVENVGMSISLKKIFQIYGVVKVLKAILLFRALQVKIESDEVYIDYIVVDQNHRSLGIGSTLLQYAIRKTKRLSKSKLALHVLSNNLKGKALYERIGFITTAKKHFPRFVRKRLKADYEYRMEFKI